MEVMELNLSGHQYMFWNEFDGEKRMSKLANFNFTCKEYVLV